MLDVRDLACRKGERLLFRNVGFSVGPGELLWVEGANGSGKTSLLRILAGLSPAEAGTVTWQGRTARCADEHFAASVLYQGHHNAVKDDLSAIENLQFWNRAQGNAVDRQAAGEVLRECGLAGREDLPVRMLSQGQRRRAALARLWFASARPLWILDEPFAALDAQAITRLSDRLARHLEAGGLAVLTTHQEVPLPADRVRRLRLDA